MMILGRLQHDCTCKVLFGNTNVAQIITVAAFTAQQAAAMAIIRVPSHERAEIYAVTVEFDTPAGLNRSLWVYDHATQEVR